MSRWLLGAAAVALLGLAGQRPALADYYAFGFSVYDGNEALTLNFESGGSATVTTGGFQGWVSPDDVGTAGPDSNTNYITGVVGGIHRNDFFVFDLSGQSGAVTSASLSVSAFTISGDLTWTLYQPSVPAASLFDAVSPDAALYAALVAGPVYGSTPLTAADSNGTITVDLDSAAIAAINSDIGTGDFAIGGSVIAVPAPEPMALSLLGVGLLGLCLVRRRRA